MPKLTVPLTDSHNPDSAPRRYCIFRLTGGPYDGRLVGALDGYRGSQCINIVSPPEEGFDFGTLTGVSCFVANREVREGLQPGLMMGRYLSPLSEEELRLLGFLRG